MQLSFFDLDNCNRKLDERDPLIHLDKLIDWEDFDPTLESVRNKPRKSEILSNVVMSALGSVPV